VNKTVIKSSGIDPSHVSLNDFQRLVSSKDYLEIKKKITRLQKDIPTMSIKELQLTFTLTNDYITRVKISDCEGR
jgi:hypothetical protein